MDGPSTTGVTPHDSTEDTEMQDLFIALNSVPDSPTRTPTHSSIQHPPPNQSYHPGLNTTQNAPFHESTDLTMLPWIDLPPSPQPHPHDLPTEPQASSSKITLDLLPPEDQQHSSSSSMETDDDDSWERMSNPDPVQEFWTQPRNPDDLRGLINFLPVIASDAALLRGMIASRLAEYQNVQTRIREVRTQIAYIDRQIMAYAAFEHILNSMHDNESRD